MAFANFSVIALGSLLMGVPVLLHLMMKKRPTHQLFPAMRFLQQKQISNQRSMRLRHWLLLALRIAAIGLLAALFARPSVDSVTSGFWLKALMLGVLCPFAIIATVYCWNENKSMLLLGSFGLLSAIMLLGLIYFGYRSLTSRGLKNIGDENAPVAAALVFDASPRMGLRHQNLTRLEEAQQVARDLLKQLPTDSEVAIIDASGPGVFSVDIGNAANMVDSLQVLGSEYPLYELVQRAVDLVAKRDDKRQEVYVLTDLSENVWAGKFESLKSKLEQQPELSLFVVDVGSQLPRNAQLGELKLNADSLAAGQPLRIDSSLKTLNIDEQEISVEVLIETQDDTRPVIVDGEVLLPDSVRRRRIQVALNSEAEIPLSFKELRGLPSGISHGQVRLSSQDGLAIDNTRYFTIEVRPPLPVLLVTSNGAEAKYVEQSISPTELRKENEHAFDCHVINANELLSQPLDDYSAIALLDPTPLPATHWKRLEEYVRRGGGLANFLGRNASPKDEFNAVAKPILPGPLGVQWRTAKDDVLFVRLENTAHPMLSQFRGSETIINWDDSPIFRHWSIEEMKPGANVIARFSNDQPAIIETIIGSGRVLTMTTPVSDQRNNPQRPGWNYLPTSEYNLPFFMLMYGMFPYLANQSAEQWNHSVGEVVELPMQESELDATWQLFTPQLDWQNIRSENSKLVIPATNNSGHYRLRLDQERTTGFSTNLSTAATQVNRLDPEKLDDILGEDRYTLARGTKEINRGIGRARVGRELFPFLMLCVVGILVMEYLVSNRFYGTATAA